MNTAKNVQYVGHVRAKENVGNDKKCTFISGEKWDITTEKQLMHVNVAQNVTGNEE